jgi:hypothetical protein
VLDLSPAVLSQVSPDQMEMLHRIGVARAAGTVIGPTPDNQRLFTGLLGEASTDPQTFILRDLHASFDQLPAVQYQRLLSLKQAITSGDPAEQNRQIVLASGLGLATNDIATAACPISPVRTATRPQGRVRRPGGAAVRPSASPSGQTPILVAGHHQGGQIHLAGRLQFAQQLIGPFHRRLALLGPGPQGHLGRLIAGVGGDARR